MFGYLNIDVYFDVLAFLGNGKLMSMLWVTAAVVLNICVKVSQTSLLVDKNWCWSLLAL